MRKSSWKMYNHQICAEIFFTCPSRLCLRERAENQVPELGQQGLELCLGPLVATVEEDNMLLNWM